MSRGKRYSAEQIIKILREAEIYSGQGKTMAQAVRACSISEQTYYRWRKEYGGINIDQATQRREIVKREDEDALTQAIIRLAGEYRRSYLGI